MILEPFQQEATEAALAYLRDNPGKNPLLALATGTGKSLIIAEIVRRNPAMRIVMATHSMDLIDQNHRQLKEIWPEAQISIYSAGLGVKDKSAQIIYAGIQSIWREDLGKIDLLIIDEAHTVGKDENSRWMQFIARHPDMRIVGLSATTFRLDSGNLTNGEIFDDVVYDYHLGKGIKDGYLVRLSPKHTKTVYDISGVRKLAGEYHQGDLERMTNVDSLTRAAVAEMCEMGKACATWLIFTNGVAHAFAVRDVLRSSGIMAETVTGETPTEERQRILEDFKAGHIRAVTNFGVWTTGVNVPGVDLIGMLRHTLSGGLLIQMAGRGTRPIANVYGQPDAATRKALIKNSVKPVCLFLDFAGNIDKHGMLDQITGKDKKPPGMQECPDCATICLLSDPVCPDCGYNFEEAKKKAAAEREAAEIERKMKLQAAHKGEVIAEGRNPVVHRRVVNVSYHPHNLHKEGKVPCIRVCYTHPDGTRTQEYKSPLNIKARGFFIKWWDQVGNGEEYPFHMENLADVMRDNMWQRLKKPTEIVVDTRGEFERVIHLSFKAFKSEATIAASAVEDNTLAQMEDIDFA